MRQWTRVPAKPVQVVIVLIIAVVAWSAPIDGVPQRNIPSQVHSLATLDRISLAFSPPLPDELRRAGLSEQEILAACAKGLSDAGFEIVAAMGVPQWRMAAILATDDQEPNQRAYALLATLDQSVRVERLDRTLTLPTYLDLVVGLNAKEDMKKQVKVGFDKMVTNLIKRARLADSTRE